MKLMDGANFSNGLVANEASSEGLNCFTDVKSKVSPLLILGLASNLCYELLSR